MKIYYHDKEITGEEARDIIAGQIGTLVAKEVLDDFTGWEDALEDCRLLDASEIILSYLIVFRHIEIGLWEGEDGVFNGGWKVFPAHFGLRIEDDFECDLNEIED